MITDDEANHANTVSDDVTSIVQLLDSSAATEPTELTLAEPISVKKKATKGSHVRKSHTVEFQAKVIHQI